MGEIPKIPSKKLVGKSLTSIADPYSSKQHHHHHHSFPFKTHHNPNKKKIVPWLINFSHLCRLFSPRETLPSAKNPISETLKITYISKSSTFHNIFQPKSLHNNPTKKFSIETCTSRVTTHESRDSSPPPNLKFCKTSPCQILVNKQR